MSTKKKVLFVGLAMAMIALPGWAKGGRGLKEGMAPELRGEWATTEHGLSVEGFDEGVARLEVANTVVQEAEVRHQEEKQRTEQVRELVTRIEQIEPLREKAKRERQRLEGQMGDLRATIAQCAQDHQELARRVRNSEDIQKQLQVLAIAYNLLNAETGEEIKSEEALERMVLQRTPGYLEVSQAIDRRLSDTRSTLASLEGPWKNVNDELAEYDGMLSALRLQLLALGRQEGNGTP